MFSGKSVRLFVHWITQQVMSGFDEILCMDRSGPRTKWLDTGGNQDRRHHDRSKVLFKRDT